MKILTIFESLVDESNLAKIGSKLNLPQNFINYFSEHLPKKYAFWGLKAHVDGIINGGFDYNTDTFHTNYNRALNFTPEVINEYFRKYYIDLVEYAVSVVVEVGMLEIYLEKYLKSNDFKVINGEITFDSEGLFKVLVNDINYSYDSNYYVLDIEFDGEEIIYIDRFGDDGSYGAYGSILNRDWENKITNLSKDDVLKLRKQIKPKILEYLNEIVSKGLQEAINTAIPQANKDAIDIDTYGISWLKYIINDLFKVENRPTIDIKTLTFAKGIELVDKLNYINDWANNPNVPTPNLRNMSWQEAERASQEWHEELHASSSGEIENEMGEIIHKFEDGYYWIKLDGNYCSSEGKAMGHCGKATRDNMDLYSLRSDKKPVITLDYDPVKKEIIQLKGNSNTKPIEKYHPYILWFISDPNRVKMLNTHMGYKPETNFRLEDLSKNQLSQLTKKNPYLKKGD